MACMRTRQPTGPSGILLKSKGPYKFPHTDPRVESGLLEGIKGKFSLQEKEVPNVRWKGRINTDQDCQEVVLECVNGMLHLIAAIHVWRDKLKGGIPHEGDCFFISGAGFVVQNLEINREPTGRQTSHDCVVGCDAVAITLGLKGLPEDEVYIGVEGNHDILVARASSDREAASVIGEELAEQFCYDKNLVGRRCNGRRQNH